MLGGQGSALPHAVFIKDAARRPHIVLVVADNVTVGDVGLTTIDIRERRELYSERMNRAYLATPA